MDSQKISSKPKRGKGDKSVASHKAAPTDLNQPTQAIPQRSTALLSRDELLLIDGIDPVAEMALNSIGIRKFADFRGYTSETLSQALLERAGTAIAAATIAEQDWIGWAELHAAEAEKEKTVVEPPASVGLPNEKSPAAPSPVAEPISPEPSEPEIAAATNPDQANGEMVLSIQQARFHQFEKPAPTNAMMAKFLRGEIDCYVAGSVASDRSKDRVALCTQVFAADMATDAHMMLAAQWERWQPSRTEYRFNLEFAAPPVGRYQLHIVTLLLEENPKIASYPGPLLRVIP